MSSFRSENSYQMFRYWLFGNVILRIPLNNPRIKSYVTIASQLGWVLMFPTLHWPVLTLWRPPCPLLGHVRIALFAMFPEWPNGQYRVNKFIGRLWFSTAWNIRFETQSPSVLCLSLGLYECVYVCFVSPAVGTRDDLLSCMPYAIMYEHVWFHVNMYAVCDHVWTCMVSCEHVCDYVWTCIVSCEHVCDYLWTCMNMYCFMWTCMPYVIMYEHVWFHVNIYGFMWTCMVSCEHVWFHVNMYGFMYEHVCHVW